MEVVALQPAYQRGNFRTIAYDSRIRRSKRHRIRSAVKTHRARRLSRLLESEDSVDYQEVQPKYDNSQLSSVSFNLFQNLKDVKISQLNLDEINGQNILPMYIQQQHQTISNLHTG